jgi:hypothetical protein
MARRSLNRVNETQVADAVLEILSKRPSGQATIAVLVRELPTVLKLSEEDRRPSKTRHSEEIWEQQVRNITSHKKSPGNFIYEGYLATVKGGLRITDGGRLRLKHRKGR